jgi:hypothetical protein
MHRSPAVVIVSACLAIYGLYAASFIPPLLVGTSVPLLLAGFVVQACAAFLAAFAVWEGSAWAPGAVMMLGVAVAITELVETFILGIIGYDYALMVAVLSVVIAFATATLVRNTKPLAA